MHEITGWLIDLYAAPEGGIKLWVICENGERLCLQKNFAVTFYAGGEFAILRRAWVYLRDKNVQRGMNIRYVFTYESDGVSAWGAGGVERKMVDVKQYLRLLKRAEAEVLDVFGESIKNASFAFRRVQS